MPWFFNAWFVLVLRPTADHRPEIFQTSHATEIIRYHLANVIKNGCFCAYGGVSLSRDSSSASPNSPKQEGDDRDFLLLFGIVVVVSLH